MVLGFRLVAFCSALTVTAGEGRFTIEGRKFLVDGNPIQLKGVCWSAVPIGGSYPQDQDREGYFEQDSDLMVKAGINAVRVYDPLMNRTLLDGFHEKGIYVINMAYVWGGDPLDVIADRVNAVKDHPAIIMWEVGNEWNYNGFYYGSGEGGNLDTFEKALQRAVDVVDVIKQHDTVHPVSTVYGEIPSAETVAALSKVDVWAINAYRGIDFTDLFDKVAALTDKPIYLGEFGADAWDARDDPANGLIPGPNYEAHAEATTALTEQIFARSTITGGDVLGGMIFELADEWWKAGNPSDHDSGGQAPGGGPYPDKTFNEEWWGLVDIMRVPRPAYYAYKYIAMPVAPAPPAPTPGPAPTPAPDGFDFMDILLVVGGAVAGALVVFCFMNSGSKSARDVELSSQGA